jgi:hypothetical protein
MNIRGEIGSRLLGRRGWVGEVKADGPSNQTSLRTDRHREGSDGSRAALLRSAR